MKLLLPLLSQIKVDSGFGIRNPSRVRSLKSEPGILVQLWKDFDLVDSKKMNFHSQDSLRIFLPEIFSDSLLMAASLATVEFDLDSFSAPDKSEFLKSSFEAQCLFRDQKTKKWSALLYDMIPDKKPNHKYAPILHCAHSAYVSSSINSYGVLANFRPPYLKPNRKNQDMNIQLKSPKGDLLAQKRIEFAFNSTVLVSFKDEFSSVGGFQPGCTMNFKGGESQFAIFTLFQNNQTGSLGIEHSLAPFYYCSGLLQPESREIFYRNAFSELKDSP